MSISSKNELQYMYKWDYETITQEIPELQNYLVSNKDLKKISAKLASSIKDLLKRLKPYVTVNFGKKKNLY